MLLATFQIITNLQGSVVVFTSYSSWTYDDPENDYYCHKTPMLFAFILLLIKWLLVPAIMVRYRLIRNCWWLVFIEFHNFDNSRLLAAFLLSAAQSKLKLCQRDDGDDCKIVRF